MSPHFAQNEGIYFVYFAILQCGYISCIIRLDDVGIHPVRCTLTTEHGQERKRQVAADCESMVKQYQNPNTMACLPSAKVE